MSTPIYTLGAGVTLLGFAVVLVVTGHADRGNGQLVAAFIITTVPSLFAAGFAERTSRDVRNGVIVEKSRQGAHRALEESGVTDAVAEGKETTPAALRALSRLLEETEAGKIRRTSLTDLLPHDTA